MSGVILSGVVRVGDNLVIGPDSLGQFTNTSVRSIQRKRVNVDVAIAGQSASFALKRIRRNQVRKGMVLLSKTVEGQPPPRAVMTCDAEILCLYHSTTLSVGSCMVLHAASIRQTVKIVQIAKLDAQGNIISSTWPSGPADIDSTSGDSSSSAPANRRQTEQQQRAAGRQQAGNGQMAPPLVDKPVVRTGDRALLRLQFIRTAEYLEPGLKLITREGKTKLIGVVRAVGEVGPLRSNIIPGSMPDENCGGGSSSSSGGGGGSGSKDDTQTERGGRASRGMSGNGAGSEGTTVSGIRASEGSGGRNGSAKDADVASNANTSGLAFASRFATPNASAITPMIA